MAQILPRREVDSLLEQRPQFWRGEDREEEAVEVVRVHRLDGPEQRLHEDLLDEVLTRTVEAERLLEGLDVAVGLPRQRRPELPHLDDLAWPLGPSINDFCIGWEAEELSILGD